MSDDKPTTQINSTSSTPWGAQQPYLQKGFQGAQGLLENPVSPYPNSTVIPQHADTLSSLDGIRDRARAGSSLRDAGQGTIQTAAEGGFLGQNPASGLLQQTAQGDFLGQGNPYLDQLVKKAQGSANSQVDARFSGSGRYGSGLHRQSIEDTSGNLAAGIYAPAYESERSRMLSAAGTLGQIGDSERRDQLQSAQVAPAMAEADYGDLERLGAVGGAFEAQGGAELQDQISRYYGEQQAPRDALKEYMALVAGGKYGGGTQASKPIYSDTMGKYLSYAGTGASIAGGLFGKDGVFS